MHGPNGIQLLLRTIHKKNSEFSVNFIVINPNGNMKKFSFSTSENLSQNICSNSNPKKLLECGDIETNPGPTQNQLRSSGGRKRKRGFQNKSEAEKVIADMKVNFLLRAKMN